jgi:tetratricopeptide (TPR) repeat protein
MEIGEIYFSRLLQFQKAADHYQKLILSKKFDREQEAFFEYRIARSWFQMNRIKKAVDAYEKILVHHPGSKWTTKVLFDLGSAWYALGDSDKTAYSKAIKAYQDLKQLSRVRDHRLYVEAVFGEASTLEELDKLEEAFDLFKSIENDYPAPNVIQVRMIRLGERMKKKRK